MRRFSKSIRLALLGAFLCFGLNVTRCNALPGPPDTNFLSGPFTSAFTTGDFDGNGVWDDVAVVRAQWVSPFRSIYNISIHTGSGITQDLSVIGPSGGFELIQRDVTGNQTPDLVLAAPWMDHPLAVLINMDDGKGTFFVADPTGFHAANTVQPHQSWGSHAASWAESAGISTKRFEPREFNGRGDLPPPKLIVDFPPTSNSNIASLVLISSVLGRAPPSRSDKL